MFDLDKIIEHLDNIHYDLDSVRFANYIEKIVIPQVDRKSAKILKKHLTRYIKACKKDVLLRRKDLIVKGENLASAMSMGALKGDSKAFDILVASDKYSDLIDVMLEGDIYEFDNKKKSIYFNNNYRYTINNSIEKEYQVPNMDLEDYYNKIVNEKKKLKVPNKFDF